MHQKCLDILKPDSETKLRTDSGIWKDRNDQVLLGYFSEHPAEPDSYNTGAAEKKKPRYDPTNGTHTWRQQEEKKKKREENRAKIKDRIHVRPELVAAGVSCSILSLVEGVSSHGIQHAVALLPLSQARS